MKPLKFLGSSQDDLRNFPQEARRAAGFELWQVQRGLEPSDWKPMNGVILSLPNSATGLLRVNDDH